MRTAPTLALDGQTGSDGRYVPAMVIDPLSAWLSSDDLIGATGHCLSWANPDHPGYEYPELTGLLLSFLSRSGHGPRRARQLHDALSASAAPDGVRRGEITYAFDTAMALRGLLDFRADGAAAYPVPQWTRALVEAVETGRGCHPTPSLQPSTRWSLAFGPHQAKLAAGLCAAGRHGVADPSGVLAQLRDRTLSLQQPDGRFRIHAESDLTYLHAHCYAVEGLLMIGGTDAGVRTGVAWLSRVQGGDGGFRAWHDGVVASGPARSDATAQAIRLFRYVDETHYQPEIESARAFLSRCIDPRGGVRYEPDSADRTAWSTIFAAQALAPAGHPVYAGQDLDLV